MKLKIKKVHPDAKLPEYMSDGAVGFDLYNLASKNIRPGQTKLLRTGIAVQVPDGYEMTVRPRSGLCIRMPNYLANSIGTIDPDYRGEILIPFVNNTRAYQRIYHGDRIAQGIISPVIQVKITEVEELDSTKRGTSGFGSSGLQ